MWGSILDGSDVSVSRAQRTLTDAPPISYSVTWKRPIVAVVPGDYHTVPAGYTKTAAWTTWTTWFDSTEYAGYCTTPTTGSIYLPSDVSSFAILPRKKRLHPRWHLRYHPHPHFLRPVAYAFWSHTNTSSSADVDRCWPPHTESTAVRRRSRNQTITRYSHRRVFPWRHLAPLFLFCPTLWTTSLTFPPPANLTTSQPHNLTTARRVDERQHYATIYAATVSVELDSACA